MYKRAERGWLKHLDFVILDILSLQLSFLLAYWIRQSFSSPYRNPQYQILIVVYSMLNIIIPSTFSTMHNILKHGYYEEFRQMLKSVALELGGMAVFMFAIKTGGQYSRVVIALTAVFHLFIGYLFRVIWKKLLPHLHLSKNSRLVFIAAAEKQMEDIIRNVESHDNDGLNIAGLIVTDADRKGESILGNKVVANLDGAAEYICQQAVDEIIFGYDRESDQPEPKELINDCRIMGLTIHIILPLQNELGLRAYPEKLAGFQVITNSITYGTAFEMFLKRLVDILGGLVGSIIALIIMAVIGPKIKKASPGKILYTQERIGKNGRHFKMYKIRSMYPDADARKAELMKQNRVEDGLMFKLDWDPRIIGNEILADGTKKTGIGEFIRKTSLDEFPQFFNILKGDMSLVGTRPPTVDEWEKYELHHRSRLSTKPGLTGMWQVSGRSEITDFEEVVRLDTEYIENWTIGLDIKILLKTVLVVLKHRGAM